MQTIVIFVWKSILISGLFTAWYYIALSRKKLYNYNRAYLLFSLFASICIPMLSFNWVGPALEKSKPVYKLLDIINVQPETDVATVSTQHVTSIDWKLYLFSAALIISGILVSILLIKIFRLVMWTRKIPTEAADGYKLLYTDIPEAPFTFFSYLFWKEGLSLSSECGQRILRHELRHIREYHTHDKLLCNLATSLFWINPFFWLIRHELFLCHEFVADEAAVDNGDTETLALMILTTTNAGAYLGLANHFYSSPIKRRLTMLQKQGKTSNSAFRRLIVLPLVALSLISFSFDRETPKTDRKFVLVLDAGHGGKDAGGRYQSYTEKDMNLRIVKRLSELAPGFGIQAELTRTNDDDVSIADRVSISNKIHPDAFMSIHINDMPQTTKTDRSDFSIFIAANTEKNQESAKLGSFIAKNITQNGYHIPNLSASEKQLMVLRDNTAPSILVECGDIKNSKDMEQLIDDKKLTTFCTSLLAGIVEFSKGDAR